MDFVGLDQGVSALRDRLVSEIRKYDRNDGDAPELRGVVAAISLLMFGHDAILEGIIQAAVRDVASRSVAELTDVEVIAAIRLRLPESWLGKHPRQGFFGPRDERNLDKLAAALASYTEMTEYDPNTERSDTEWQRLEQRRLAKAVTIVETLLQTALYAVVLQHARG